MNRHNGDADALRTAKQLSEENIVRIQALRNIIVNTVRQIHFLVDRYKMYQPLCMGVAKAKNLRGALKPMAMNILILGTQTVCEAHSF